MHEMEEIMKNRVISTILAAALVCSLTACSGGSNETAAPEPAAESTEAAAPEADAAEAEAEEAAPAAESEAAAGLKIAIVSSPSGVDDGSFNQDNYNGILSFIIPTAR